MLRDVNNEVHSPRRLEVQIEMGFQRLRLFVDCLIQCLTGFSKVTDRSEGWYFLSRTRHRKQTK